jgi:hypothetical protein
MPDISTLNLIKNFTIDIKLVYTCHSSAEFCAAVVFHILTTEIIQYYIFFQLDLLSKYIIQID